MRWINEHVWHFICGFITVVIGYFEPIDSIFKLMFFAVIADFFIGIYVSLKIGKAIKSKLMWRTAEKMLICVLLVLMSYSAYRELGMCKLHIYVAWGIFGFEFWSILESVSKVNNSKIFRFLKKIMESNIEKRTGVKIDK